MLYGGLREVINLEQCQVMFVHDFLSTQDGVQRLLVYTAGLTFTGNAICCDI